MNDVLFERAKAVIPGGVNSPVRAFRAVGGTPRFVQRAQGAYFWDADGKKYIDYIGSWGPMILGHGHPAVLEAVQKAAVDGFSFGAPTEREVELAEAIIALVPTIEQIRLVSSGTEAGMSALRLARGATGRSKIIKFEGCYHGHADALLVKAGSGLATFGNPTSAGVPPEVVAQTLVLEYNNLEQLEEAFKLLNVVVLEHQSLGHDFRRHAGAGRVAESSQARSGLDQQRVGVAVVAALELDDLAAPGGAARQPQRAHAGLGA